MKRRRNSNKRVRRVYRRSLIASLTPTGMVVVGAALIVTLGVLLSAAR